MVSQKRASKAVNVRDKKAAAASSSTQKPHIKSESTFKSRPKRKEDDDSAQHGLDDGDEWMQQKQLIKPVDQLDLTEDELKEEFTRILTANNPHAPNNIVRYNFKDGSYKQISSVDQLAIHFSMEGNLLHKDSEEAKKQMTVHSDVVDDSETVAADEEQPEVADETEQDGRQSARDLDTPAPDKGGDQKLTNQFNFCERASQTYNNPSRERGTITEPPPRATFSATFNQWEIYDAYVEDLARQEQAKEKESKKANVSSKKDDKRNKSTANDIQSDDISRVGRAAKIVERMVNQNTFDEIAHDFKYWEDPADDFNEGKGTILPLWKFSFEKAKRVTVTTLCWSPMYQDLFAVGHGSYEFMKQDPGMICFYSLKNPTYPEHIYTTESGVMTIDIHPKYCNLLAVGFYDGSVAVYNITENTGKPSYLSTANSGKHTDPVWQVRWQPDDLDGNLNFYSTASDGRVVCWTVVKSELHHADVILLQMDSVDCEGPEGTEIETLASGSCFDFHKSAEHMYLVGTEEGLIYKCSKKYSSQYLGTYNAHHMAVYSLAWNYFHQNIFLSGSADWTVKIWDHNLTDPMFTFDLGSAVSDVAWAPFASTVFAAVTTEGKVVLFDLNVNKYEPICQQFVVQKKGTKLTHVSFNPVHPILIVGDDRGYITSLKLSPNIRKALTPKELAKGPENEIAKMDKLLALVREPSNDSITEQPK